MSKTKKAVKKRVVVPSNKTLETAREYLYDLGFETSEGDVFCCGVDSVGEFRVRGTMDSWNKVTPAVAKVLKENLKYACGGKGIVLATTVISTSGNLINIILPKLGFKRLKDFVNDNSGNRVRLWIADYKKVEAICWGDRLNDREDDDDPCQWY